MNDLAASLGLGNLELVKKAAKRRQKIANIYRKEFKKVSGIQLLENKKDRISANWIFTMLVKKRNDFIKALKKKGIPAFVVHLRIDKNSVFGGIKKNLPDQEKFNRLQISIPVHENLSDKEVNLIVKTIKKGW